MPVIVMPPFIVPQAATKVVAGTLLPRFGSASAADGAPEAAGWTRVQNSNLDDSYMQSTSLFSLYVYGTNSTAVFGNSNSYLTIVGGSASLSPSLGSVNGILVGTGDNSSQRIYVFASDTIYRMRFEGMGISGGSPGSSNLIWEITFVKPEGDTQFIEILIGNHSRLAGPFGYSGGGGKLVNGGTITPNQSYTIVTDGVGNNPVWTTGSHLEFA